ncbi:signal peptidase II [Planctomycetota bacterium]|nr:signal peptidase II [Planctomycetota bacterium]
MTTDQDNSQSFSSQPDSTNGAGPLPKLAYKSACAITVFLLVTISLIAADLLVKYYSFECVAPHPVEILQAEPDMEPSNNPALSPDTMRYQVYVFKTETDVIPSRDEPVVVIPKLLNLQLVLNPGAVFGLGKGGRTIFIGVSIAAIIVIAYFFSRSPAKAIMFHLGLAFILAGALGNMYDRVTFGVVRDMFYMFPGTRLWPWVFNVADVELIIGVGLVILHGWLYSDEQPQQPKK